MAKEQAQLTEVTQKLAMLEARLAWFERIFQAYGVQGPWLNPSKAAPLLGVSSDRIRDEIEMAEQLRLEGKTGDLIYNEHYRDIKDPRVNNSAWQVNVSKFAEVLGIPPEKRKVG